MTCGEITQSASAGSNSDPLSFSNFTMMRSPELVGARFSAIRGQFDTSPKGRKTSCAKVSACVLLWKGYWENNKDNNEIQAIAQLPAFQAWEINVFIDLMALLQT